MIYLIIMVASISSPEELDHCATAVCKMIGNFVFMPSEIAPITFSWKASKNYPKDQDLRFRVEHAQIMTPADSAYYTHPNIIASVQPTHATSDMYWAEERLGHERIHHAYSYLRIFNSAGDRVAFGTDFPIEHIDPLATFLPPPRHVKMPITGPNKGFCRNNVLKLSPGMAITAMTQGAAYTALSVKSSYGSIAIGQMRKLHHPK